MPIYEYRCENCGHELEVMQKMADAPLRDCPECAESTLRKKISAVAFRLKGSGWYETDFKSGNKKNLVDGGDKSDNKSDNSKSDSKSESKSDSTSSKDSTKSDSKSAPKSDSGSKTSSSSSANKSSSGKPTA